MKAEALNDELPSTGKTAPWLFVLSVLLIYPLPQLAIDVYLPSWPAMVQAFHTTPHLLQLSLTLYVLCLGLAQLIYGPLSDRFGRKPILLIGITIFFFSSFASMFIDSGAQLLLLRAIQGLGIGCGFTIASALLADTFKGHQLAKMTSYSAMIYALSLICAPLIGAYLQHYIGWRANFAIMAAYAFFLCCMISCFVTETKSRPTQQLSFSFVAKKYMALFSHGKFVCALCCLILAYGTMIAFNVVGPFLLQNTLHVPVIKYGQLLLLLGVSYFFGATFNSYLVKRLGIHSLIIIGLLLMLAAATGLLTAAIMHWFNVTSLMSFVCLSLFSLGFIYPNCFAYALDTFAEKGYASALIGSAILIGVAIVSALVSHYNVNHEYCLSVTFLILSLLSITSYLLTRMIPTGG